MYKILLSILCCLLPIFLFSQESHRRLVTVFENQEFYLNGGIRSSMGGRSRAHFKITLPPNTIEWIYSVTTVEGEQSNEDINLLAKLTRVFDGTGLTDFAISQAVSSGGTGICDVYLFSNEFLRNFRNKAPFRYDLNNSRENFKSGNVRIEMKPGYLTDFYIGFKNPSSTKGVTIKFSAVAVVAE